MLVPYKWLKDYVDVEMDPDELAHRLTMAGLEVGSVEKPGGELEGVVVGFVQKAAPHPHAEKLSVCTVDIGQSEPLTIVCGAPNVAAGQKVPVAVAGTSLPCGKKINEAVIRQVKSQGMICSAEELGLDPSLFPEDQQEGIMVLPEGSVPGGGLVETLGLDDVVFDIELTPNRADCLSIRNVAREAGAIAALPLKPLDLQFEESSERHIREMISVDILAPDLCGRYVAKAVEGITVGPSPAWLQNRLKAVGVRPISNIVDVTNFVMMEMGQPLHAFDYRYLEGKTIIVRRSTPGEKIVTLDRQERELSEEMLVIADGQKPVAIAGVMGGENSEIMEDTSTVLIESANFNMVNIRRTSRKLGLRSESSLRFEKGVNIEGALEAANRAAQLMAELGGGRVVQGVVDNYPRKWTPIEIHLSVAKVNRLLGLDLSEQEISELLSPIGLTARPAGDGVLAVSIPSFRLDLERDVDLVEEVARLYGYDRIPLTIPKGDVGQQKMTWEQVLERKCKGILVGCGLTEAITFSFMNPKGFDKMSLPQEDPLRKVVEVTNPLSEDQKVMRTTLIPNLLEVAQRNAGRKVGSLSIFEFGRIFSPEGEDKPSEKPAFAGLVMGSLAGGWKWAKEELDFFFLKGVLEELLGQLGVPDLKWELGFLAGMHPGRTAGIMSGSEVLGFLGEVHPDVLENYSLNSRTCVFQLDFNTLARLAEKGKSYTPLQRFPSAERDLAVIVSEEVTAAELETAILQAGGDLLADCHLFDVYRGDQVPEGKKSVAYALVYQSRERTLTDEEINTRHGDIKEKLAERFAAELR